MSARPSLVCLTPVKDEAWILERFLAAAATWADAIVVADQASTDSTRAIAEAHDKAIVVENTSRGYDEGARQRLLIDTARQHVPGEKILIALDADEALTADAQSTGEWARLLAAAPGTVLRFPWLNLLPGGRAWIPPDPIAFGFVDDGSEHTGESIHSTRLPTPAGAPVLTHDAIGVLHLQYLDWERMKSKQRWYQAWERLNHPEKRPIQVYRQYHRMDAFPPLEVSPARPGWVDGYERAGIDLTAVKEQDAYSWDADVLRWLRQHPQELRRADLWDADWQRRATAVGQTPPADPRSAVDRRVLRWLGSSQPTAHTRPTRLIQRGLRVLGW
jgi:hypothetical protein